MRRFSNLEGTLMEKDVSLVSFCIERGEVKYCNILSKDLPLEFLGGLPKETALLIFLDDRVVPETRIGLEEDLKRVGIPYFNPDLLLKFNNGFSIEDHYWIRFRSGVQTYQQLCDKIFVPEEVLCQNQTAGKTVK